MGLRVFVIISKPDSLDSEENDATGRTAEGGEAQRPQMRAAVALTRESELVVARGHLHCARSPTSQPVCVCVRSF